VKNSNFRNVIGEVFTRYEYLHLTVDKDAAREAGMVIHHPNLVRQPIGNFDLLIAGHALSLKASVVTNNLREYERVPGLKVENWLEN
jgi:tRNA(fMet)-specific endonuclease VapC